MRANISVALPDIIKQQKERRPENDADDRTHDNFLHARGIQFDVPFFLFDFCRPCTQNISPADLDRPPFLPMECSSLPILYYVYTLLLRIFFRNILLLFR